MCFFVIQVNFNEPLSLLQRLTEDFEYAELLHKSARISDPAEQLIYIAAFCVSHYATTGIRTCKPFNPLLGETFECDRRDDLGWKSLAEQVKNFELLSLKVFQFSLLFIHFRSAIIHQ